MPTILSGIINIAQFRNNNLKQYSSTYLIRINAIGELLEFYIKDSITGSFTKKQEEKEVEYSKVFSYLGNQNNPPDLIIKNGDAFEIKKIEGKNSAIALNSSYPKNKLYASDYRITSACRSCEIKEWKEKDFFYIIGQVNKGLLKTLVIIQGECYCAEPEIYQKLYDPLKEEIDLILSTGGFEKGETKELGKVKKIDPLGITDLRIRGMWDIQNPIKVFSNIINIEDKNEFSLYTIMTQNKYLSLPKDERETLEKQNNIEIKDIKIKNPNNPAKLLDAKLISLIF